MRTLRLVTLLTLPLLLTACVTATTPPTAAPTGVPTSVPTAAPIPTAAPTETPTEAPTQAPTDAPTADPTAEPTAEPSPEPSPEPTSGAGDLDPSLSDAGIVGRVTLTGDSRGFDRDGTYDIIGVSDDGSYCSFTFSGEDYQAVAFDLSTDTDQIQRMSVTIPWDAIPEGDGETTGVDGRVSFDFNAESVFGMTYTGDSAQEDDGVSTIDVTRVGEVITFDFDATTWDDATFSGQLVCATV